MSSLRAAQENFLDLIDDYFVTLDTNGNGLVSKESLKSGLQANPKIRNFLGG